MLEAFEGDVGIGEGVGDIGVTAFGGLLAFAGEGGAVFEPGGLVAEELVAAVGVECFPEPDVGLEEAGIDGDGLLGGEDAELELIGLVALDFLLEEVFNPVDGWLPSWWDDGSCGGGIGCGSGRGGLASGGDGEEERGEAQSEEQTGVV